MKRIAVKYRAYPTPEQKTFFAKVFGCKRFVYNRGLEYRSDAWEELGFSMSHLDVAAFLLRWKQENPWLAEAPSQALQMSLRDLEAAYQAYFRRIAANKKLPKKKRKDPGAPKYKSKKGRQSFQLPQGVKIMHEEGHRFAMAQLPKCGEVKIRMHRVVCGTIKTVTVSMEPSGACHVTVLYEVPECPKPARAVSKDATWGADLGMGDLLVGSDGERVENPRWLNKAASRIKSLQKTMSRRYDKRKKAWEQSHGYEKARRKYAKAWERLRNRRDDFLHKVTTRITRDSQAGLVCVEDLNVTGMFANKSLARSASDACLGQLARMLEYKCAREGIAFQKVGRFFPSTQRCSKCGHLHRELRGMKGLSIRQWNCPECGASHDRDLNAAVNIAQEGLRLYQSNTGSEESPCTGGTPGRDSGEANGGRPRHKPPKKLRPVETGIK